MLIVYVPYMECVCMFVYYGIGGTGKSVVLSE